MKITTLGSICTFEGGSQPPRSTFIFEPREGYVRLIQIRDYKSDEYITYIPLAQARKFCNADDIMIGRYGPPIFQILQGLEGAYNVALMKAVPTDPSIDKEFLRFYLKRDELLHHLEAFQQRTVGQAGIEMNELKNYPIPVPTLEQQQEFVAFVQQSDKSKLLTLCVNSAITRIAAQIDSVRQLQKSYIFMNSPAPLSSSGNSSRWTFGYSGCSGTAWFRSISAGCLA